MIQEPPPAAANLPPAMPVAAGQGTRPLEGPATGRGRRRLAMLAGGLALTCLGVFLVTRAVLPAAPHLLSASGTLEADETLISAQVSARITELPVPEGSRVTAGAVVARLDDRLVQLQMQEADVTARRQLEIQDEYYVLRSPLTGTVTRVPARVGEMALPGQVLLAVGPTDRLKLTLYVREADLPRVLAGQQLVVTADPFPGRAFSGQVTSISSQAEFTPRNVQTQADRLNLVFGVQALVSNPDGALKAGMPVDAEFQPLPVP